MITYLFGAGASAQAVPIISDIKSSIQELIGKLHDPFFFRKYLVIFRGGDNFWPENNIHFSDDKAFPQRIEIKNLLLELISKIGESASIDTVARRLYLTDRIEYRRYKALISFWLSVHQLFSGLDNRYELFLATLLDERTKRLPESKLNILSWNYDFQLEMAMMNFMETRKSLKNATLEIGLASKHSDLIHSRSPQDHMPIYLKLNGTCTFRYADVNSGESNYLFENINPENIKECLVKCLESFHSLLNSYVLNEISFSWEPNLDFDDNLAKYKDRVLSSRAIVVIGYSFPTFNRKIDRIIFDSEKIIQNKIKIYVQDKCSDDIANKISMNFGVPSSLIVPLNSGNVREFFVPPEFD